MTDKLSGQTVSIKGAVGVVKPGMLLIAQKSGKIWCTLDTNECETTFVANEYLCILGARVKLNGYDQVTRKLQFNLEALKFND